MQNEFGFVNYVDLDPNFYLTIPVNEPDVPKAQQDPPSITPIVKHFKRAIKLTSELVTLQLDTNKRLFHHLERIAELNSIVENQFSMIFRLLVVLGVMNSVFVFVLIMNIIGVI